jgi:iron complex outermembrane receptor protein
MARIHRLSALATALSLAFAAQAQTQPQTIAPATESGASADTQTVTITQGRGQVRSVQGMDAKEFTEAPAGTSPLVTVSRLPGVNFQSADPLGNYEWSTRFTVRSFSQSQLGFTLDNVPLGDMSYGNFNGLHISRAISSENVGRAFLSQGSGSLDTASSSNLGGTLQFYSRAPEDKFGLDIRQTLGSDSENRTFGRVDTGATGFGALSLSFTNQDARKWKGEGHQRQKQVNIGYLNNWGVSRLSAFVDLSQRREIDYQDMSKEMIGRLGTKWDNFFPDTAAAVKASNTLCGNGGSTYVAQCDDAYYAGSGLRNDTLMGSTFETLAWNKLHMALTAYDHTNKGQGLWYTPYKSSPNGVPVSVRTTEYNIDRTGEIASFDVDLGANTIKFGLWHEDNDFNQARRFYAVASATSFPSPYDFLSNPFSTQWQYKFKTTTNQYWLSDDWAVTDALTVTAGFKGLRVSTAGTPLVGADVMPSGTVESKKNFLPQVGANFKLSSTDELFTSYSKNMRAFQGAATGTTPFATTIDGFNAIKNSLKPETSDDFEGGWRTHHQLYEATLAAYLVNFHNRLLSVQSGSGIVGNPVVLSNVGGVRTYGLEAAVSLRLQPGLTWTNSFSESRSTYRDDVISGKDTILIKGKHVVDAPDTMLKSIVGYDNGSLFGDIGADFMSKRYYSYSNDASVPSRLLFNASAGFRFAPFAMVKSSSLQLNVTNLTDRKTISTLGSNGFVNNDAAGTAQTLLPGAPREFTVTFAAKF